MKRVPTRSDPGSAPCVTTVPGRRLSVRVPVAAEMLGIGKTKLYELIAAGEVEVVKIGTATLIPVRSLEALIERHCTGAAMQPAAKRGRGRPRASFRTLHA